MNAASTSGRRGCTVGRQIDIDSLCYYLTNLRLRRNDGDHVGLDHQLLRRPRPSDTAVDHTGRSGVGDRLHVYVDDHGLQVVDLRDVDGVHLGAAAACLALGHLLLGLLRYYHQRRRGLPVRHVQRHLREAEDEAQHVGERHEHVLLQRAVREPDHRAEHQEEGERDRHELHALGPDHLPLQASR
uniref:Uncharacterized protein n=1 Tax=Zea mays TaxID=4577 RepID=C0P6Y0_MAIZE|nr:unknown [Zea mays]